MPLALLPPSPSAILAAEGARGISGAQALNLNGCEKIEMRVDDDGRRGAAAGTRSPPTAAVFYTFFSFLNKKIVRTPPLRLAAQCVVAGRCLPTTGALPGFTRVLKMSFWVGANRWVLSIIYQ